jgi:hypothetical protein
MDALAQATRVVFALDCATSFLWLINSFIIVGFGCWSQLLVHIVVGVHFGVQTVCFAFLLDDQHAHDLEADEASRTRRRILPRRFPAAWITASIYALLGDFSLLSLDAHNLLTEGEHLTEACMGALQYELFIESIVTAVSLLSIGWFIALNIERRWKRDHLPTTAVATTTPPQTADPALTQQIHAYMAQYGANMLDTHLRRRKLI